MEDDLPQPQDRDDRAEPGRGLEERLDPGAVLPEVQGDHRGKAEKLAEGLLDLPAPTSAKKAATKKPTTAKKASPKPTKAA